MHKPVKYVEKAVTVAAKGAWVVFDRLNRIKQNPILRPAPVQEPPPFSSFVFECWARHSVERVQKPSAMGSGRRLFKFRP
jgi:hypothetical protein